MIKKLLFSYREIKFEYKITFLYLIFGLLWIFFSDEFFNQIILDKEVLTLFQTIKGFFYVFVTSLFLFILVKRHSNYVKIAYDKAKESERLKSAFLMNLSHEIRTPMNGILGFAHLLTETKLTGEEKKEYIAIIESSADRMLDIINNIVEISKIESGNLNCKISETDIIQLTHNIFNNYKNLIYSRKIDFKLINNLENESFVVKTDRDKLESIFSFLLNNAIKYTNKGSIEFGFEIKGAFVEFYVKDTGIGIPKDRQEAVFESFIQADIEDVNANQGAGLGLAIAKEYLNMMNGKIWVESEIDKGTTFYFNLPK